MLQSAKLVVATIDPFKIDEVLEALRDVGAQAPTVTEARSYRRRGRTEIYRGVEYTPEFVRMLRVEVDAPSGKVDQVIDAIVKATGPSQTGDEWIDVYCVERHAPLRLVDKDRPPPLRAA